jgi:thiol:disulfide interchange protein
MPSFNLMGSFRLAFALCLFAAVSASAKHGSKPVVPPGQKAATTYDESRDPARDLQDAMAKAKKADKRILLEVGGDWCMYCNIMDETFDAHPNLRKVRDANYVTLKVSYSDKNPNAAFLSQYPKIADYPHFFVLDSDGTLLHSQPTHPFEHGSKYNASKIEEFLNKWCHPPAHWLNLKKSSTT